MIFENLRASAWRIAAAVLGVLAVALLIACLFLWGRGLRADSRADAAEQRAQASDARVKALSDVLADERARARRANEIAAKYEQDKINAEADAKRTVDDLRAGNLRLRKLWQGCEGRLPEADGGSGKPDAISDDRAESAGRIVRAADEADAQIMALQRFILSERE